MLIGDLSLRLEVWPQIAQIFTNFRPFTLFPQALTGNNYELNFYINKTYEIIGFCMEVHRTLGLGFSEIVYKDAITPEAKWRNIPVERERKFTVQYKGDVLPNYFVADFIVFGNIIVEVKAIGSDIDNECISQTLNYLRASGCRVGLIINFGKKSLEYKRLIF